MKKLIFATVILASIMMACDSRRRSDKPFMVPSSAGNPYEVMVVAEDSIWDGPAGKALRKVLNAPLPMLPQDEPMFHVTRISPDHYDRITNLFRNIIVFHITDDYREPKIKFERDVHSYQQAIVSVNAPDSHSAAEYIAANTESLQRFFTTEEINRQIKNIKYNYNTKFNDSVKKYFGCEIMVPPDIMKMKIGKDFIWGSNDGLATIQNICVYSYPFATQEVFEKQGFINLRNDFMKKNIPGYNPGSVMETTEDIVKLTNRNINGRFVQEARGLWDMTDDAMGGPFVSHSLVDSVNNRVVVVEAFVYAPSKMKRSMLRRLEASLYTIKLPADLQNKK